MTTANQSLSSKFLLALNVEKHEDYETTHEILSTTPPKILAANGLALLNLVIENIRTSIGGKLILELVPDGAIAGSTDKKPIKKSKKVGKSTSKQASRREGPSVTSSNPLANNDFKTGDIVRIDTYPNNSGVNAKKIQNSSKKEDTDTLPTEQIKIEGVVTSSNSLKVCVALTNSNFSDTAGNSNGSTNNHVANRAWDLQASESRLWMVKISNESTYRRMESTLRKLSEFSLDSISSNQEYAPRIVQYLLGTQKYTPPTDTEISNLIGNDGLKFVNKRLNDSQKQSIKFGLTSPLTIIHGPPGTGKTSTLVEYVIQHMKIYPNKRILITAPSNIAVDTIIERLSVHFHGDDARLVRIGHPARILPSTRKHSLDVLVSQSGGEELDDLQSDLSKLEKEVRKPRVSKHYTDRREIWKEIKLLNREFRERNRKCAREVLIGAKVVVATLHGSGSWEIVANLYNYDKNTTSNIKGFGKGFFHTVIIDEVSQALEPSCWIPIINHSPDRLVLAGDNKQLPPTIHVSDREEAKIKQNSSSEVTNKHAYVILSQSLFDRVVRIYGGVESEIPFIKFLDTQYRMCQKCMEFPSNEWYGGQLKAADEVKDCKVIDLLRQHKLEQVEEPIAKIKKNGKRERKRKSKAVAHEEDEDNSVSALIATVSDINIGNEAETSSDSIEQVIWYDTQGGSCPESIEVASSANGRSLGFGGSKFNIGECYVVQKHIQALLKLGVKEGDIGIIAPYTAQVARLRSLLWTGHLTAGDDDEQSENFQGVDSADNVSEIYPDIEISTVDGFQGREKEIIILSLVRSNFGDALNKNSWDSSDVGFLSDFRRLNVSITRCKKQLVIVGDMETLEQSGFQMLKDWCDWCTEHADIRYTDI